MTRQHLPLGLLGFALVATQCTLPDIQLFPVDARADRTAGEIATANDADVPTSDAVEEGSSDAMDVALDLTSDSVDAPGEASMDVIAEDASPLMDVFTEETSDGMTITDAPTERADVVEPEAGPSCPAALTIDHLNCGASGNVCGVGTYCGGCACRTTPRAVLVRSIRDQNDTAGNATEVLSVDEAPDGSLFVLFRSTGSAQIYAPGPMTSPLPTADQTWLYLARYTRSGERLWFRQIGRQDPSLPAARSGFVRRSPDGRMLIAAAYSESVTLEGLMVSPPAARGGSDTFIASVTMEGLAEWLIPLGTMFYDTVSALAVGGELSDPIAAVGGNVWESAATRTDPSTGGSDAFVVTIRVATRRQYWAPLVGFALTNTSSAWISGVAVGADRSVYVGGGFSGQINLAPSPAEHRLSNADPRLDGFLVRYNPMGEVDWSRHFRGTAPGGVRGVSIDGNNPYTLAWMTSSIPFSIQGTEIPAHPGGGGTDLCITRFDPMGTIEWFRTYGGSGDEQVTAFHANTSGAVYFGGRSAGMMLSIAAGGMHTVTAGRAFVASVNRAGAARFARTIIASPESSTITDVTFGGGARMTLIGSSESMNPSFAPIGVIGNLGGPAGFFATVDE